MFYQLRKTGSKLLDLIIPFLRYQIDSSLTFFWAEGCSDVTASSLKGETLRCLFLDLQTQTAFSKKFLQPLRTSSCFNFVLTSKFVILDYLFISYYPSSFSQSSTP